MADIKRRLMRCIIGSAILLSFTSTVSFTVASALNQSPEGENKSITKISGSIELQDIDDDFVQSESEEEKVGIEIPLEGIQYDSKNFKRLIESNQISHENMDFAVAYLAYNQIDSDTLDEDEEIIDDDFVELASDEEIFYMNGFEVAPWEIDLVVKMVQHELGSDPRFFPDYDFDYIQQCEARIILNRVGTNGWKNMNEILLAPNQFITSLSELSDFDPTEPRTRQNVLKVLRDEDNVPEGMICSMSWPYDMSVSEAIARQSKLAGFDIKNYEVFYANCGDFKQLCIFGCMPSSDSTT